MAIGGLDLVTRMLWDFVRLRDDRDVDQRKLHATSSMNAHHSGAGLDDHRSCMLLHSLVSLNRGLAPCDSQCEACTGPARSWADLSLPINRTFCYTLVIAYKYDSGHMHTDCVTAQLHGCV